MSQDILVQQIPPVADNDNDDEDTDGSEQDDSDYDPDVEEVRPDPPRPTNYGAFVVRALAASRQANASNTVDQARVRECLELASSFLVSDLTMNPERQQGLNVWYTGFKQLVDLVVVLHRREQLDVATLNVATRACSECWTAAGNWRDLEDCRSCIREAAGKLRGILDPNSRTYRGERVYAP